jgi:hypothetical protein
MKLFKKQAIGIKQESTQGTPVVPSTSTDYILVEDVTLTVEKELLIRDYRRASLDKLSHVVGERYCKVSFKKELVGSGTRGDATIAGYVGLDAALQACGVTSVSVASTTITYAPTSSPASANYFGPGKSVTMEIYKDGLKHIVSGCLGNVKLMLEEGKYGFWEFEFQGVYADPTDVAVPTPTIVNVAPPIIFGATVSIQGFSAIITKFELDFGNKVSRRQDAASATGIKGFVITDRDPKGSVQLEAESVATHNFFNKLMTSAEASSSIAIGSVAGNIHTITTPKSQYNDVQYQNRDNFLDFQIPLQFNGNSGDDWLSYVQT